MNSERSSFSSLDWWTDDEDEYQSITVEFSYQQLPEKRLKCHTLGSFILRSEEPAIVDPIYENLDRNGVATAAVYAQLLRSRMEQIKSRKQRAQLVDHIFRLFHLETKFQLTNDAIVKLVEERLVRLIDSEPKKFRALAEQMCQFLQKSWKKNSKMSVFKSSIRKMFTRDSK